MYSPLTAAFVLHGKNSWPSLSFLRENDKGALSGLNSRVLCMYKKMHHVRNVPCVDKTLRRYDREYFSGCIITRQILCESKECVSFTSRRQSRLCLVFNRGFDHLLSVSQEAFCLISLMILKLPPYSDKDLYSFYLKSLFGIFMKIYLVICYCSSLHWHPWYKWISIFGSHTVEFPSLLEKHRYFWKSYPRLCSYKYTFYILH